MQSLLYIDFQNLYEHDCIYKHHVHIYTMYIPRCLIKVLSVTQIAPFNGSIATLYGA